MVMFSGLTSSMRRSLAPRLVVLSSMLTRPFRFDLPSLLGPIRIHKLQELRSELVAHALLREPVVAGRHHRGDVEYAAQHADRADDGFSVVLTNVVIEHHRQPLEPRRHVGLQL